MANGSKWDRRIGFRSGEDYIYREKDYAQKRREEVEVRDTIIAEGYAERQMAETLRKVEKIKTEL